MNAIFCLGYLAGVSITIASNAALRPPGIVYVAFPAVLFVFLVFATTPEYDSSPT